MVNHATVDAQRAPLRKTVLLTLAVLLASIAALAAIASAAQAKDYALQGTIPFEEGGTTGTEAPTGSWVHLCKITPLVPPEECYSNEQSLDTENQTYTPIKSSETGLSLDEAQAEAYPPFDGSGNSLSEAIVTPRAFGSLTEYANFGLWTSPRPVLEVGGEPASKETQWIKEASILLFVDWAGLTGFYTPANDFNLTGEVVWNHVGIPADGGTITLNWTVDITRPSDEAGNPFSLYTAEWHITGPLVW